MDEPKRPALFPISDPAGKPNSRTLYRVALDGSVTERVFLHVPDMRERERLICVHYLRHLVHNFISENIGISVLGRDDPWDFRVELSNGDLFNVEITSIADNPAQFEIAKREERFAQFARQDKISIRDLGKIAKWFNHPAIEVLLHEFDGQGLGLDDLVDNPLESEQPRIFLGPLPPPTESLTTQIRVAVDRKLSKPHHGVEETVLIIDNRTSAFDIPAYREASESLVSYLEAAPFKEIWFYTGYYSDSSGNEAEFSFGPLKITGEQRAALQALVEKIGADEYGRLIG
jgi:hypothetical protein